MLHDVIILVHLFMLFSICFIEITKIKNRTNHLCNMFFPRKGTLTLTPGMGGEHLGPLNRPNHKNKCTRIVHTSGSIFKKVQKYL